MKCVVCKIAKCVVCVINWQPVALEGHCEESGREDIVKLLETSATLLVTGASLVTGALLVVTMFAIRNKCHATSNRCIASLILMHLPPTPWALGICLLGRMEDEDEHVRDSASCPLLSQIV